MALQDASVKRQARESGRADVASVRSGKGRSLVTGGSGFIGQHVVTALRDRGDFVRILDLQPPSDHASVEFVEGSIVNRDVVRRAMQGVDRVYHLAGISHLWIPDRRDYGRVNHTGTQIALATAAELGVRRFIHCSTEAILPSLHGKAANAGQEACLDDMAGAYTRSKFLAEQAALAAARAGLPVTVISPAATIGPGDHNFTAPTAMLSMFVRRPPPLVLDGLLNLVDVRDVANGILLADTRGRIGERYVLGGADIRVRDLLQQIGRLSGRRNVSYPLPRGLALAVAVAAEWLADNVTHRNPIATAEGVRLALRSVPLDIRKAQSELGYIPRALAVSLADALSWLADREGATASAPVRWAGA
jgi:dihydroflavonol-4-reductase